MNLVVHIPDELAARVSGVDPAQLERAALQAVLNVAEGRGRDQPAVAGIESDLSPREAGARMRASRAGNSLPQGMSIRDLMTHGRA